MKVYMTPTPDKARLELSNSINQIVVRMEKLLPEFEIELVGSRDQAQLVAAHAGHYWDGGPADVAHISGLYPTFHFPAHEWHWQANHQVLENVRYARRVTVPSQWVADLFRRDMHLTPDVVAWGIDPDEWQPTGENGGYILWNKTRVDGVCDPTPMNKLAEMCPERQFISTFGNALPNVKLTGRLEYEQMKPIIQNAGVYLSTTIETFGIGTLEAMSSGIPVLGFNWGGTAEIVKHGVTGYLVEPGDYEGLKEGLEYCLKYRDQLGENAREVAKQDRYSWRTTAQNLALIYRIAYLENEHELGHEIAFEPPVKVSVVIPVHNYAQYVGEAIESVKAQETDFKVEIVVVDDGSTDDSFNVAREALQDYDGLYSVQRTNGRFSDRPAIGVANARNFGIERAEGSYITCLDADDRLGSPKFLQTLADALDADRRLGIVYTGLTVMDADGNLSNAPHTWPAQHDFEAQLQRRNQVPTCCMFRKMAWTRAGGYRKRFQPAEDANLWTRIGSIGYTAKMVTEEGLFHYRLHGNSLSSAIRQGEKKEPDWLGEFSWIRTGLRPFACDGKPPRGSWPVRNYCLPAVSVIIPCSEAHREYLQEAIDSVEAQTYQNWELIIVDDAESDESSLDYYDSLPYAPYARIVQPSRDDGYTEFPVGAGAARNVGVKYAKAPLVVFLDADDMLHPEFLEKTIKLYRRTGKYVYTDWVSLNKENVYEPHLTPDYDPALVFQRTSIHAVTILIPRADLLRVGGFDETMIAWEDTDLQMKLAANGICGVRVPEPLLLYRYLTGSRRENGEQIKPQLIDNLRERYKEFITGEKMCNCVTPQGVYSPGSYSFTVDGKSAAQDSELVRIEYQGGMGLHQVIGPATKQDYRYRAKGDTFFVYAADVEAMPEMFKVVSDLPTIAPKTEAPPPPKTIEQLAAEVPF